MYYFIALLIGTLISIMIGVNGGLSDITGVYSSSVIIHLVGLAIMIVVMVIKKVNPFKSFYPWYLYLGGVMGVLATAGNNYSFAPLGVSAILALGLLGQSITGLVIDQFGLFGMKEYKLKAPRLIALFIMIFGAVFMIRKVDILAMVLSFAVGGAIVLQRVFNSMLAEKTNTTTSTAYTYIVGLIGSLIMLILLGQSEPMMTNFTIPTNFVFYIGGAIGTVSVVLSMMCVGKIPSYSLSILMFIGQLFAGIMIDAVIAGEIIMINLIGGLIITFGLIVDIFIDRKLKAKEKVLENLN